MAELDRNESTPVPDPMIDFAAKNDLVNVARLLDEGWNIDKIINNLGWTLLDFAAFARRKELAALLLERGARIHRSLDIAIKRRSPELIELIKSYEDKQPPPLPLDPRDPNVFTRRNNEAWEILMDGDIERGLRLISDLVWDEGTGRYVGNLGVANLLAGTAATPLIIFLNSGEHGIHSMRTLDASYGCAVITQQRAKIGLRR